MAYVGRDAFFGGVRAYLDRHAWGNTTLADLLVALEQSSGRELRAWADGWLRTTGVSTLRPVWDGDALAVEQESPTPRIARIGVGRWDLVDGVLRRRDRTEVEWAPARRRCRCPGRGRACCCSTTATSRS